MDATLHIFDHRTPAEMLDVIDQLAATGDRLATTCPARRSAMPQRAVEYVRRPLGRAELAGLTLGRELHGVSALAAWSSDSIQTALWAARRRDLPVLGVLYEPVCPHDSRRLAKWCRSTSLRLAVPTAAARARLTAAGVPEGRIFIVPPPARELPDRLARRQALRDRLGLAAHEPLLVAPAEMIRMAGHRWAVWTFVVLRRMNVPARLLLPCGGPHESSIRALSVATGESHATWIAPPGVSVDDALAAADVAILLPEVDGVLPTLTRAMGAGCAIVASDLPGMRELTGEGAAALLAPPCNPTHNSRCTLELVESPALADRLGQTARALAQSRYNPADARRAFESALGIPIQTSVTPGYSIAR